MGRSYNENKELSKLVVMLSKADIPFDLLTWNMCGEGALEICSPTKDSGCAVSAVSHMFSYGGSKGLIEVLGSNNPHMENDDVVGYLTAEEAFKYFDNRG